jgi:hypothetical protein
MRRRVGSASAWYRSGRLLLMPKSYISRS